MGKFHMPRASFIPKASTKVQAKNSSAVAYLYSFTKRTGEIRLGAMGFAGKADKPAFHYTFKNERNRSLYVAEFFRKRCEAEQLMIQRKAEQKGQPIGLEVGDVLRSMWGYDQTNIDYYEVTRVLGRMVEIRALAQESVETMHMQGECVPLPGKYVGEPMRKLARDGRVKIESYAWASKVEPVMVGNVRVYKPSHWTSYA